MKYQKVFSQWYILQYAMAVIIATYTEAWNIAFKTSKPPEKYENIKSTYSTNLKAERKAHSTE